MKLDWRKGKADAYLDQMLDKYSSNSSKKVQLDQSKESLKKVKALSIDPTVIELLFQQVVEPPAESFRIENESKLKLDQATDKAKVRLVDKQSQEKLDS